MTATNVHDQPWFHHPSFSFYWRTYSSCMQWLELNHVTPIVADVGDSSSDPGPTCISDHTIDHDESEEITPDYEIDEVDQGYLEFIAVTLKHQEEREKEKERKKKSANDYTYVDITQVVPAYKTGQAPESTLSSENAKLRKKLQLTQWYGCDGDKINDLEMALQVTFDEYCEEYSPSYFPHCPINMKSYFDTS